MKKWKWLIGAIIVFTFIVIVVPLLSRSFLTQYALRKASEVIGAPIQISNAELDLLHGGLAIHHLKIFNPIRPKETFVSMDTLRVHLPLLPLLKGKRGVLSVAIKGPMILYRINSEGNWELQHKLPILVQKGQSQKGFPFDIEKISIDGGVVKYDDRKVGKTTTLSNLDFVIRHLEPASRKNSLPSSFDLQFKIDDQAKLHLDGKGDFLSPKISFQAQVELSDLPIPLYSPYYDSPDLHVIITKGFMAIASEARCNQDNLRAPAHATISQLEIRPKNNILNRLNAGVVVEPLKNKNGNLDLDLLIAGNLRNPQFHITTNLAQAFAKGLATSLVQNAPQMIEKVPEIQQGVKTGIKKLKNIFGK